MRQRMRWVALVAVAFVFGGTLTAQADPPLITGEQVADDSLTGADIVESSLNMGWVRVESAVVPVNQNSQTEATAECPAGTRPLGGGHELRVLEFVSFFPFELVTVRSSMPAPNIRTQATGWFVEIEPNGTYNGLGVRAYVICAAF